MKTYLIKNGCKICQGDIIGNETTHYLCKNCNITYTEEYIGNAKKEPYSPDPKDEKDNEKRNKDKFKKQQNKYEPPKMSGYGIMRL